MKKVLTTLIIALIANMTMAQWSVQPVITQLINVQDLHFITTSTGYAVGTNQIPNGRAVISRTTDAGASWTEVFSVPPDSIPSSQTFNDINFVNNTLAFASGGYIDPLKAVICKSTNGGNTWDTLVHDLPEGRVRSTHFFNANTGFCVGINIYKSTNGGVNWTMINSPIGSNGLDDIYFTNADTGFAIGVFSTLLIRSVDGGATWDSIGLPTTESTRELYFVDNQVGFIGCDNGVILKTTDGGSNWTATNNNDTALADITAITFASTNVGFAGTLDGSILKTVDGGDNWFFNYNVEESQFVPFASVLSLDFPTSTVGYAGTGFSFIARTTNAGGNVPTSVNEVVKLESPLFYPNPVYDEIQFERSILSSKNSNVIIRSASGQVMLTQEINEYQNSVDVRSLTSGVYLVQLNLGNQLFTSKLMKE